MLNPDQLKQVAAHLQAEHALTVEEAEALAPHLAKLIQRVLEAVRSCCGTYHSNALQRPKLRPLSGETFFAISAAVIPEALQAEMTRGEFAKEEQS